MPFYQLILPYLGLIGGVLIEGESFLLAASVSAHFGYMNIYLIIFLTIICTQASDWFWFLTGRKKGRAILEKRKKMADKISFLYKFIDKYPYMVMFLYRFVYGFRSIMPLLLGTSKVKARHYLIFGLSSTIIWSASFAFLGFYFGSIIQNNFNRLKQYEYLVLGIISLIIIGILLFRFMKNRRKNQENLQKIRPVLSLPIFRFGAYK